jgi:pimeloyl-ACP methyl ester carboxylesterase
MVSRRGEARRRLRAGEGQVRERLLAGLPVRERRLELAGTSTTVLEGGHGPSVVLLHGAIECGAVYWAPLITSLAQRYRVVAPDKPGLGESEPVARLDSAAFADWFAALLRLTCDEPPSLIAHSMGGSLAAGFAINHSQLLRRLVLMGSPGIGRYHMPPGLIVTAVRFSLRPTERNNARFARWAFNNPEQTRRRDPGWYDDVFMSYGLSRALVPHVRRAMGQLIKAGAKRIREAELRNIEVPTALLWGRQDRMVPLRLAERTSSKLGWPLHVFDDAGHVPFIEQPDTFLQTLRLTLSSLTDMAPR